jgi:hypothetical protein
MAGFWEAVSRPEVIAAALSFLATIAAAVAAYRAPLAAAEHAEHLRKNSADEENRKRIKLNVFGQVMQERGDISQRECVIALNLIDIAFYDSVAVREAWAELHQSLAGGVPEHVRDERLRKLLRAMAADLGLADNLRLDDFARVYYPNALAEEAHVRIMERKEAIRRLGQAAAPAANSTTPAPNQAPVSATQDAPAVLPGWPPRPTAP